MKRRRRVADIDYESAIAKSKETIVKYNSIIEETRNKLKEETKNLKKLEKNFEVYKEQKAQEEKELQVKKLAQSILDSGKSLDEIEKFLNSGVVGNINREIK